MNTQSQTPLSVYFFTAIAILLSSTFAPSKAWSKAETKFICGSGNLFLADEAAVVNLLDSIYILGPAAVEARSRGSKVSFPKRNQCGLPGEVWRICTGCTSSREIPGYSRVLPFLADPAHREWHAVWHKVRREISADGINSFPPDEQTLLEWQRGGWIPLGDDRTKVIEAFVRDHRIGGRLAGEDFFFMHRQMIKMLQIEMANLGVPCIAPWVDLPPKATDAVWPVPRLLETRKTENIVHEQRFLNEILEIANDLKQPDLLRSISLSELGNRVEAALHGKLHVLYASGESGCRNPDVDNSLTCDDLTHDRSAHLNKYFWKLHGFVDGFVGDWLRANGKTSIATDCTQVANPATCHQWSGTWLGRLPDFKE